MKSIAVQIGALAGCLALTFHCGAVHAEDGHHHHPAALQVEPVTQFIASTAKPFNTLMDDAMAVMQKNMADAAMNGVPAHDFVALRWCVSDLAGISSNMGCRAFLKIWQVITALFITACRTGIFPDPAASSPCQ